MNNLDYIKENINIEVIIDYISLKYCKKGACKNCPVRRECNDIYDLLENRMGKENVTTEKVITYWLTNCYDSAFSSHSIERQKKKMDSYHWKVCGLCKRLSTEVPMAKLSIDCYYSPRKIAYICEDCYPELCKILNVPSNQHLEPSFLLTQALPKQRKKPKQDYTICWQCGTKCSPKHSFCHECGERLDN